MMNFLGTVLKYLRFFLFSVPEKGGEGVGLSENRKPEKKPEENRSEGGGLGLQKIENLRKMGAGRGH